MRRLLPGLLLLASSMCHVKHSAAGRSAEAQTSQAQPTDSTDSALATTIAAILSDPAVTRAHWGIAVAAIDTTTPRRASGPWLYGLHEGDSFQPASNAKLFTTAAALALLGVDGRVQTMADGHFSSAASPAPAGVIGYPPLTAATAHWGVVLGNLVLHGAGDANLSGRALPYIAPTAREGANGTESVEPLPVDRPTVLVAAIEHPDHVVGGGLPTPVSSPVSASPTAWQAADPLRYLAAMADGMVANGLVRIEGDVIGDDTLYPYEPYAADWAIDDMVWGYGAPVSALSVNDNQMRLTIAPATVPGEPAVIMLEPRVMTATGEIVTVPCYRVAASVLTGQRGSGQSVRIDRAVGSRVLEVSGTIAVDAKPDAEEVAIADPAEFAALAMKMLLQARGVVVTGAARARHRPQTATMDFLAESHQPLPGLRTTPVAANEFGQVQKGVPGTSEGGGPLQVDHLSPLVGDDVVVTNKVSQNLHAELLLHHLSAAYGEDVPGGAGKGSIAEGARVVRQFLLNAGLDGSDFVFYDGSGLSGHDLVTPRAVVELLRFASAQPWFDVYKSSLPVGGVDGGLTERFRDASLRGHVFAKTGTLGEVRALSGYLECQSGRTVAFSILVGNRTPGSSADRTTIDKIVAAIAQTE